jgi:NADH-quinone oxidoreductase subunit D/NADH-quinone oxidoreductase subunit C/D
MSVPVYKLNDIVKRFNPDDGSGASQQYFLNLGPQHPAAHGVLRVMLRLDGETVVEAVPVLGYIHRGVEKMGERLTCRQFIHLTDRLDYFSATMNNWAVARTVERAAGIEVSERAEWIRTMMAELQRLQSHLLWLGVLGMDLGAFTPFLWGFRDREELNYILEETIGARLTMNYVLPGGVMTDLHPEFAARVKRFVAYIRPKLGEYEAVLGGNVIFQERLRNIGRLSADDAVALGATGPVLRGSGVALDLRKTDPYGAYGRLEFSVPVGSVGDCWDRFWVRFEEMRQSLRMIEQLLEGIPEGPVMSVKPAAKLKLPEGIYYSQLETARGILGVFIAAEGGSDVPYRIHLRSPTFNNLWPVTALAPGWRIADLVAILASLDLVIPDIDR